MEDQRRGAYLIHSKPVGALLALKDSSREVLLRIAAERKEKGIEGQGIFMMITKRTLIGEDAINIGARKSEH
jgi:hypothetical protein